MDGFEIGARQREAILLLCLSDSNRLIHHSVVSEGTVDRSALYVREILKPALVHNATRLVLIHNHPSGDPSPSPEDVQVTERIVQAGKMLDIDVLDHLIIGKQRFVSLKERQLGF